MDNRLTMTNLCGLLLDGRHLVLDLSQLFFEGILGLPGAYIYSRSKTQQQELTRYVEST
jgi:hypothetical protein